MPRIAIGNHKGGSGKTAATVNLAAALAEAGHQVLVVDLDPQANASRRLGIGYGAPELTTSEVVRSGEEGVAADAIIGSGWPGEYGQRVHLLPARFDLENRVSEAAVIGAAGRLRRALTGVDEGYRVTLIDCPPSLGHLTQLGLVAADAALCTVEPEYDSVEGAVRYRDFITTNAGELGNPGLRMLGYLVCRSRPNVGAHAFQLEGLADTFGAEGIWTPHIPERAAIKDAADSACPLRLYGSSPAREMANIYTELAERLLKETTA
ncbi:ParA family protein [Saccharopolyspora sp. NPDC000995]